MSTRPRALVVGASGLLGRHLLLDLATDFDVAGTGYRHLRDGLIKLDVTDAGAVERTISTFDPQIILHAAAVSNVAACQENETACHAVNVGGVRNVVAAACARTLIFFSSDAVFDGSRPSFREEDMPAPLTAYGRQKLEGEVLVQTLAGHLVVRSARYYALKRGNGRFVDLVRGRLEQYVRHLETRRQEVQEKPHC